MRTVWDTSTGKQTREKTDEKTDENQETERGKEENCIFQIVATATGWCLP